MCRLALPCFKANQSCQQGNWAADPSGQPVVKNNDEKTLADVSADEFVRFMRINTIKAQAGKKALQYLDSSGRTVASQSIFRQIS